MSVINTNIKALIAQNAGTYNNRALSSAMQQLSTGSRINSAADDAAGLAISSRMTSQIRGLNQAVRNGNDAVSLLQTAEGAMIEITNMLQRMRELAVQSASDTNTIDDRNYLNLEYQELMKEVSRIASNTEWNGMNILNNTDVGVAGTGGDVGVGIRNVKFQVGANADQTIDVGMKDFSFGTGTPATASVTNLNLMGEDLTDAKIFGLTLGSTAFSVEIGTAVASASYADAVTGATALKTALETEIQSTVGFEDVTITRVGATLTINDPHGRASSAFTAAEADNTAVTATNVAVYDTSSVATGAVDPGIANANAVFTGAARLNDTDVTTQDDSDTAIGRLDGAIAAVNEERATLGSVINRLTYSVDNLTNVSQNASESRSRVLDTDYAKATTELARTQIIQQAATAMLAQANSQQQTVLALLQ